MYTHEEWSPPLSITLPGGRGHCEGLSRGQFQLWSINFNSGTPDLFYKLSGMLLSKHFLNWSWERPPCFFFFFLHIKNASAVRMKCGISFLKTLWTPHTANRFLGCWKAESIPTSDLWFTPLPFVLFTSPFARRNNFVLLAPLRSFHRHKLLDSYWFLQQQPALWPRTKAHMLRERWHPQYISMPESAEPISNIVDPLGRKMPPFVF